MKKVVCWFGNSYLRRRYQLPEGFQSTDYETKDFQEKRILDLSIRRRAFEQIPLQEREKVKEISLDMAANMHLAASTLFPKARLVTDRFHVVKLILEALQKIRIDYRWEAIALENKQIKECRRRKIPFQPEKMKNGETRKEMLA